MYPGDGGLIHLDPELLIAFVAADMVGWGVGGGCVLVMMMGALAE